MQYGTEERKPIVYFDTSAWNHLTKSPDKSDLVALIRGRTSVVLASVISAAEILLTPNLETRQQLCKTVIDLHGDWSLLENPFDLPRLAAEAYFAGETDFLMKSTGPGRSLYGQLLDPSEPDMDKIEAWLNNTNQNLETFISQSEPTLPMNIRARGC